MICDGSVNSKGSTVMISQATDVGVRNLTYNNLTYNNLTYSLP